MSRRGVSDRVPKDQIRRICAKVKETKVGFMVTITARVIMSDNNCNRDNNGNKDDRNGPYVPPQNREVTPRDGGDSMKVEDMLHKRMRRFDVSDEHIKELRYDLASIGQKVDTHAISIK